MDYIDFLGTPLGGKTTPLGHDWRVILIESNAGVERGGLPSKIRAGATILIILQSVTRRNIVCAWGNRERDDTLVHGVGAIDQLQRSLLACRRLGVMLVSRSLPGVRRSCHKQNSLYRADSYNNRNTSIFSLNILTATTAITFKDMVQS